MLKLPRSTRIVTAVAAACLAGSLTQPAAAVDPSFWTHDVADDWSDARLENVVITSYGEVVLGRRLERLADGIEGAQIVYDVARAEDGTIYAGTGPEGMLLRIREGAVDRFEVPGVVNVFCLQVEAKGTLLLGTGGGSGRVLRVQLPEDAAEPVVVETLFESPDVQYVWQFLQRDDGSLLIATGPSATLYRVDGNGGDAEAVLTVDGEENLVAIASGDNGTIYTGTSPGGQVWSVAADGSSRVLFDAPEPEITALEHADGALYALAAAEGSGREIEEAAGRVDVSPAGPTLEETSPPEVELPDPTPAEPDPIPLDEPDEMPGDLQQGFEDEDAKSVEIGGAAPAATPRFATEQAGFGDTEGSALYRIDLAAEREGLVTGVLRDPALLYDVARQNGTLLIASAASEASPARVIELDPRTRETAVVATPDAMQVTRLLPIGDEQVLLALSNSGGVAMLGADAAAGGTLTSGVLDAGAVAQFGTIQLSGRLPEETQLAIRTRSGQTEDPDQTPAGWTPWTPFQPARRFVPSETPAGRYFQYQIAFEGHAHNSPALERVQVAYQLPNLAPSVVSVQVDSEAAGMSVADIANAALAAGQSLSSIRTVSWEAQDPNDDPLVFDVQIRKGRRGEFLPVATDLTESTYAWDAEATGDGVYEVKVIARDTRGNPPGQDLSASRVTEPIRIDLTAPRIGDFQFERNGNSVTASVRVTDVGGAVARLEYLRKGDPADAAAWQRAFPEDGLADSPFERYVLDLKDVPDEGGLLRLRAVDDSGNLAYTSLRLPPAE